MRKGVWVLVGVGLGICLVVAGVFSYYASSSPDGLEKVAKDNGFIGNAADSANAALPTADYAVAGVENERLSVGLAGVIGVIVIAVLAFGMFWLLARGKKAPQDAPADA
jgi:cobalt/nickel transport protein